MNCLETDLHLYQPPLYSAGNGNWYKQFSDALLHTDDNITWDSSAILSMLSFNYVCGDRTLIKEIIRKPWLSSIQANGEPKLEIIPAHDTRFENHRQIAEHLMELLYDEIVRVCKGYREIYLTLSGGLDSRVVAAVVANAAKTGDINAEIVGVTWGIPDSRDVVYAEQVANILGMKWVHVDILPEDIFENIELASTRLACLVSAIHLHKKCWFRNVSKEALVLSASYGDSVGRAEFSGKNPLELQYLNPINKYGLIKNDIFNCARKTLISDLNNLYNRTDCQPKFVLCEHEMQAQYMRGMIGHAMSIINDYCTVYQVFTDRSVYSYMWSIHPSLRTDDVYADILELSDSKLAKLPWARTNKALRGKTECARKELKRAFHDYRNWIRYQLYEEIYSKIDVEWLSDTRIFNIDNIELLSHDVRCGINDTGAYDVFVWLAGFCRFGKLLNDFGKHVNIDVTTGYAYPMNVHDTIPCASPGRISKAKNWYRNYGYWVDIVKYFKRLRKFYLKRRALRDYPPKIT